MNECRAKGKLRRGGSKWEDRSEWDKRLDWVSDSMTCKECALQSFCIFGRRIQAVFDS
jgi:hypothetical protein